MRIELKRWIGDGPPYGECSERPDGLTIRIDLPYAPKQWIIGAVTVTARQGRSVTTDDMVRVSEELPDLMRWLTRWIDVETTAAAIAETGDTGDELAQVAAIYHRAVEQRQPPVVAVMDALNMKRSMANRRIRAAKDAGLIEPKESQ